MLIRAYMLNKSNIVCSIQQDYSGHVDVLQTVVPVSRQLLGGVYMEAGVQCRHLPDGRVLWGPHRDGVHPGPAQEDLPLLPVSAHGCAKHCSCSWVSHGWIFTYQFGICTMLISCYNLVFKVIFMTAMSVSRFVYN